MTTIVDSVCWSIAFRRRPDQLSQAQRAIALTVRDLIRGRQTVMLGPVRQEVLSGFRSDHRFGELRDQLRAFEDEPLFRDDYELAADFANRCRRAGVSPGVIDVLVCAVATRLDAAVLTADQDFVRYADVLGVRLASP
ncbi:MAG: PIN domain-containing protein [Dehalococcoidia bacterium]